LRGLPHLEKDETHLYDVQVPPEMSPAALVQHSHPAANCVGLFEYFFFHGPHRLFWQPAHN
jgi:hypothetical protein